MKTLAMIFIFGLWSLFNMNNENSKFKKLICSYDENSLSVSITKRDIIKGFKKLDSIDCSKELNISSFWFTIIRDGKQSSPQIIKYKNRKDIQGLLENIKTKDIIDFTLIVHIEGQMQRRTKTLKIL